MCDVALPKDESVAEMLMNLTNVRHGCATVGMYSDDDLNKIMKQCDELCDARSISLTFGSIEEDFCGNNGKDGNITDALRQREKSSPHRFHI